MPRQPRLDVPGALQHVMGRGIAHTKVFPGEDDRRDFVTRLAALARAGSLIVYAKKGTGLLLRGKCLNYWRDDFNSVRATHRAEIP